VIPSTAKQISEGDSESEDSRPQSTSRRPRKQEDEKKVPVMRRHGEPLMIMPDL